jgi:hypothetical protein
MMHFLKGGNWQRERSIDYRCSSGWDVPWEPLSTWEEDIEGLPDRWVKIIEMEISKILSKYPELKVDCIKEGLWKW